MSILRTVRKKWQRKKQKKHTPFEFVDWLRFANAGMLDTGNLYCYEYAIKNLPSDNPIIEVGSFCGLSTNLIAFYLQQFSKNNKRSEEHTSELQSQSNLVCRLLLEK